MLEYKAQFKLSCKSIIIKHKQLSYQRLEIFYFNFIFYSFHCCNQQNSTSNNNNNTNNNNTNTSTNGLNHTAQSKNSSLLKPSSQPDTNLSIKPSTVASQFNKLNKGKNQNRSKGKSTVNQTMSPPLRVDQVARPMSVSPSRKEAAKLSSPNTSTFAPTTSPQNNNSNIYVSVSGEQSIGATDGSFLEVENEIEIKTEVVDEMANSRIANSKQLVNGKKRPLNSNDSVAATLANHSAMTNGVADALPSQHSTGGGAGDETAAKKKRFKSQEVINTSVSSASELSFTNTDNQKTIKKSSKNLNESKGNWNLFYLILTIKLFFRLKFNFIKLI